MLYVWDITTGEVVYSRKTEYVCFCAVWGDISPPTKNNRYPSYLLCTAFESEVLMHDLVFDIRSMSYTLETMKLQLPNSGLHRRYACGVVHGDSLICGEFLYLRCGSWRPRLGRLSVHDAYQFFTTT